MNFKDENVFITGLTGFVGPYLGRFLIDQDANVFGLIRKKSKGNRPRNLIESGIINDLTLIEGDITDITSLAGAIDKSEPDHIFHLAAQSYVPYSFTNPIEVANVNSIGTLNLLESVRMSSYDPSIVFAGSSEEYGLVITSEKQYERVLKKRKNIFPEPKNIPEIPVTEENPLRPMSPYGVSKVFADHLTRNYFHSYGLKTKVSRAFNHEGARRGEEFVTSVITRQVMELKHKEREKIEIGNVNAFRDWSHVKDIVRGYCLISKKGRNGDVYNQGSNRVNSVLTYLLLALEEAGYNINSLKSLKGNKQIKNPTEKDDSKFFGAEFEKTKVDRILLNDDLRFEIGDEGIKILTDKDTNISVLFDEERFRPAEVPVLLSDNSKVEKIGFSARHELTDIIEDQLNYYLDSDRRKRK